MTRAAKTQVASVGFLIEGSVLTEHPRHMVLSKDWRGALSLLTEEIDGCTMDMAIAILKGEKQFIGHCGRGENTIDLVDDSADRPETSSYLSTLAFQNAGLLRVNGRVYRPKWQIDAFGPEDFQFAREQGALVGSADFTRLRVKYYAGESGIPYHISVPEGLNVTAQRYDLRDLEINERPIMWEPYDDFPVWITPSTKEAVALTQFLEHRRPDVIGADTEILDLKKDSPAAYKEYLRRGVDLTMEEEDERNELMDQEYQTYLTEIRAGILEQAGPQDGEGWMRMGIYKGEDSPWSREGVADSYIMVPKQPFLLWALKGCDPVAFGVVKPWKAVSPTGMKMYNDNPYHSDWVIGSGFDPNTFYTLNKDIDTNAHALQMKLCMELMNFEFAPLSKSDMDSVTGKIRILKPGETLDAGEIGVIASAGVEYDAALRSAAKHKSALICMTGGPLAHVATVGREMNVPIILWDKAGSLNEWMRVTINLKKGTISVLSR